MEETLMPWLLRQTNKETNQPSEAEVMVTSVHKERTSQERDSWYQKAQNLGRSRSGEWGIRRNGRRHNIY